MSHPSYCLCKECQELMEPSETYDQYLARQEYHEIESLRQQLTATQEQLKEAREVIGFYADRSRYDRSNAIESSDCDRFDYSDFCEPTWCLVGGKRARSFLAKYPRETTSAQDAR